jgi:galactokinase
MDITEQINWLGDAIMPGQARKEWERLQQIEAERDEAIAATLATIRGQVIDRLKTELAELRAAAQAVVDDDIEVDTGMSSVKALAAALSPQPGDVEIVDEL